MISLEKWKNLTPLEKLPKNVGDLGKSIVAKGLPNLVTLVLTLANQQLDKMSVYLVQIKAHFLLQKC